MSISCCASCHGPLSISRTQARSHAIRPSRASGAAQGAAGSAWSKPQEPMTTSRALGWWTGATAGVRAGWPPAARPTSFVPKCGPLWPDPVPGAPSDCARRQLAYPHPRGVAIGPPDAGRVAGPSAPHLYPRLRPGRQPDRVALALVATRGHAQPSAADRCRFTEGYRRPLPDPGAASRPRPTAAWEPICRRGTRSPTAALGRLIYLEALRMKIVLNTRPSSRTAR